MFALVDAGDVLLYFCLSILVCNALTETFGNFSDKEEGGRFESVISLFAAGGVIVAFLDLCVAWYCSVLFAFIYIVAVILRRGFDVGGVLLFAPIVVLGINLYVVNDWYIAIFVPIIVFSFLYTIKRKT